jgi:hypothetical protein
MTNAPLTQLVALDLNGTGTLVDVSQYVRGADGVTKTPTRTDQFRDATSSAFTFTLENYDGSFTPGNPVGYTNPLTERMMACWSVGNQLRTGTILSMTLAEDNWTAVTLTCDDMLGTAARNTITTSVADAILVAAGQLLLWRMDDAVAALSAVEASGNAPMVSTGVGSLVFGQTAVPGLPGTQLLVTS